MKVVCCTMYSPSHQALADVSVPNFLEYCKTHGYYMHIIHIEDNKWEYEKHKAFKLLFEEGYDVIWYKDVDSVITNMAIPITRFIDNYYSFYLTKDATEFNGGSVIILNNVVGRRLNDMVLHNADMYPNEQNFYNSMPMLVLDAFFMKPIPHPSINSYQYSLYKECPEYVGRPDLGDWAEGQFVLHVPALSLEKRIEVLKSAQITR